MSQCELFWMGMCQSPWCRMNGGGASDEDLIMQALPNASTKWYNNTRSQLNLIFDPVASKSTSSGGPAASFHGRRSTATSLHLHGSTSPALTLSQIHVRLFTIV